MLFSWKMDQISILYQSAGEEGEVFPNFELFPYFNRCSARAGEQQFQGRKRIANFIEEMQVITV